MEHHTDIHISEADLAVADVYLTDGTGGTVRPVVSIGGCLSNAVLYGGTRGEPVHPLVFADALEAWANRLRALDVDRDARLAEQSGVHEGSHAHCAICRASQDRLDGAA